MKGTSGVKKDAKKQEAQEGIKACFDASRNSGVGTNRCVCVCLSTFFFIFGQTAVLSWYGSLHGGHGQLCPHVLVLMSSSCCLRAVALLLLLTPFSHSLPPKNGLLRRCLVLPFQSSRALGCKNGCGNVLAIQLLFIWHDVEGADRHSHRQRHTVSAAY